MGLGLLDFDGGGGSGGALLGTLGWEVGGKFSFSLV
jgi:hypothetical protein